MHTRGAAEGLREGLFVGMAQLDPELDLAGEILLPQVGLVGVRDAFPELQPLVRVVGEREEPDHHPLGRLGGMAGQRQPMGRVVVAVHVDDLKLGLVDSWPSPPCRGPPAQADRDRYSPYPPRRPSASRGRSRGRAWTGGGGLAVVAHDHQGPLDSRSASGGPRRLRFRGHSSARRGRGSSRLRQDARRVPAPLLAGGTPTFLSTSLLAGNCATRRNTRSGGSQAMLSLRWKSERQSRATALAGNASPTKLVCSRLSTNPRPLASNCQRCRDCAETCSTLQEWMVSLPGLRATGRAGVTGAAVDGSAQAGLGGLRLQQPDHQHAGQAKTRANAAHRGIKRAVGLQRAKGLGQALLRPGDRGGVGTGARSRQGWGGIGPGGHSRPGGTSVARGAGGQWAVSGRKGGSFWRRAAAGRRARSFWPRHADRPR